MVTLLVLLACADLPDAALAPDRSGHFFDRPFPSDELLTTEGTIDLTGWPEAGTGMGQTLLGAWTWRTAETVHGFSPLGAIYLPMAEPIPDLPASLPGVPDDPIRLWSLDSGRQVPILVRQVAPDGTDPFLPPNLLVVRPEPWAPLTGGERWALGVSDRMVDPPEGWDPEVLGEAGQDMAFGTVFTVQDSLGQLQALAAATDAELADHPEWLEPTDLKRVVRLDFAPGETETGHPGLAATVTYEDGTTETTWLEDEDTDPRTVDLSDGPMEVWEARITTPAFRPLDERPYMSPGIGFLNDGDLATGWLDFDADGNLLSTPEPEPMRIVIQVPVGVTPRGVMTWDHGTGGHAYSAVARSDPGDDMERVRSILAEAGIVVVSRDQPLYGQRYPLIEEGYSGSLGFYNIVNLPAFRDNHRQAAVDHRVLDAFVRSPGIDQVVPGASTLPRGAFGHSLGSVTAHLGLATGAAPVAMMSGTGGFFSEYVLDTGLLTGGEGSTTGELATLLFELAGVEVPDPITGRSVLGALMGVPEEDWDAIDLDHPALQPFQVTMDPGDPMAFLSWYGHHELIVEGIGDLQVPNPATEWLAAGHPDAELVVCTPSADYDGHYCTFREEVGFQAFADFAEAIASGG